MGVDKRASKIVPAGRSSAQSGNERRMSINQASCKYLRTSCRRQLPAIVTYRFHHSAWRRGPSSSKSLQQSAGPTGSWSLFDYLAAIGVPIAMPMTSPEIASSTRRFCCRPAAVSFDYAPSADRPCQKGEGREAAVTRIAQVGRRNDGARGRGATNLELGSGPAQEIEFTLRESRGTPLLWRTLDRRNGRSDANVPMTVKRDWTAARAWLKQQIQPAKTGTGDHLDV